QILGGSHFDSPQKLSQALQEKGLSEKSTGELHELLSELRVMGQSLSRPRGRKPTERTMKRVHNTWMRLIEEIDGLVRKRRVARHLPRPRASQRCRLSAPDWKRYGARWSASTLETSRPSTPSWWHFYHAAMYSLRVCRGLRRQLLQRRLPL